jgi:MarR family transcriptional regulator, organic hydroperoxide resistance regulator
VGSPRIPGLDLESPAQELWALLVEVAEAVDGRMDVIADELGLSLASLRALLHLDPDQPISQKELAARLACTPSTVVDPTDKLEKGGLVVRRAHPSDRRVKVLTVTARGRHARDLLLRRLFAPPDALRRLPEHHQVAFRDAMREVMSLPIADCR